MNRLQIQEHVPLAPYATLRVGGPARWFCEAHSETDIAEAVAFAAERRLPLFVLGGGSNLLVSDAGFPGLVLRVSIQGRSLHAAEQGIVCVQAGAGENWDGLVRFAVEHHLAGMECLAGIPGNVGGTPVQNVGAYGQEVADTILRVRAFDLGSKDWVDLAREQCGFAYRRSIFNSVAVGRYVVTSVTYRLRHNGAPALRYADVLRHFAAELDAGQVPSLLDVSEAVRQIRARKGMLAGQGGPNGQSAGSFFKNPLVATADVERVAQALALNVTEVPGWPVREDSVKLPAAWLVERAGFPRGYRMGRAALSSVHTLALVNLGDATAEEVLALRDTVIAGVETKFGIRLEQEPVLLGF